MQILHGSWLRCLPPYRVLFTAPTATHTIPRSGYLDRPPTAGLLVYRTPRWITYCATYGFSRSIVPTHADPGHAAGSGDWWSRRGALGPQLLPCPFHTTHSGVYRSLPGWVPTYNSPHTGDYMPLQDPPGLFPCHIPLTFHTVGVLLITFPDTTPVPYLNICPCMLVNLIATRHVTTFPITLTTRWVLLKRSTPHHYGWFIDSGVEPTLILGYHILYRRYIARIAGTVGDTGRCSCQPLITTTDHTVLLQLLSCCLLLMVLITDGITVD